MNEDALHTEGGPPVEYVAAAPGTGLAGTRMRTPESDLGGSCAPLSFALPCHQEVYTDAHQS